MKAQWMLDYTTTGATTTRTTTNMVRIANSGAIEEDN